VNYYETKTPGFKIRFAEENDTLTILNFIRQLAEYENLLDKVSATEDNIRESLFTHKMAEVIIGEYDGTPVSFALFFNNFSTFAGKSGIYLEDLFVKPEMRGKGCGKALISFLAQLATERDCGRLEWSCLNWNEPSIKFYKSLGAAPMDEWTLYRLSGKNLSDLADTF